MVKQSTVKKPRAPRKKKILIDVETAALKIPAAMTPVEGSYEIVTRVPENDSLETREPPKLSATFTPETVEMKIDHSYQIPELAEAHRQAIAEQVQAHIERDMYSKVSQSATPVDSGRTAKTPEPTKIEPFIVDLSPTPREFVPFSNDLSKYQIVNPDGSAYTLVNVTKGPDDFLYVGEAERVAREEAEAASKDGYFTPTRPVIKRYDFLPGERKKIIIALVAGIFCLLGLIALATLAFFGEIGIFS